MGRVQTLLSRAQTQGLDDPVRRLLERHPATVVLHQTHPEVVERLLWQMALLHAQTKGMVPLQIELQLFQGLLVGQVEHLFQDVDAEHGLHRPVGPAIVRVVHVSKPVLINQRQRLVPEHLRPAPLQQLGLLRRHQELGLPQAHLRVSRSEHDDLPRSGATPKPGTPHYVELGAGWRGVFTNESTLSL